MTMAGKQCCFPAIDNVSSADAPPLRKGGEQAAPLHDRGSVCHACAAHIEAFIAVSGHQHRDEAKVHPAPLLVGAALARPLNDRGPVGHACSAYIEALSTVPGDDVGIAESDRYEQPILVGAAVARPLDDGGSVRGTRSAHIETLVAVLGDCRPELEGQRRT